MRIERAIREDGESKYLSGLELIAREKNKQARLWTSDYDDQYTDNELAMVASLYATPVPLKVQRVVGDDIRFCDPWPTSWASYHDKRPIITDSGKLNPEPAKIMKSERIKNLAIAGAFIASEIDRLTRLMEKEAIEELKDKLEDYPDIKWNSVVPILEWELFWPK